MAVGEREADFCCTRTTCSLQHAWVNIRNGKSLTKSMPEPYRVGQKEYASHGIVSEREKRHKKTKKERCQQHPVFPGGHPSKY